MTQGRFMIVEDEGIVARDIKHILEENGHDITGIAYSADEAIHRIEHDRPDMILMDIMLNGEINGIDASRLISEKFEIPVVFVTAYSDKPLIEKAKKISTYGYILKPLKKKELEITVEMGLARLELEKKLKEKERMLRHSEEKFRTVFESSPIGLALYSDNWDLINANRSLMDLFGAESLEELMDYRLLTDPDVIHIFKEKLASGEQFRIEIPFDFELQNTGWNKPSKNGMIFLEILVKTVKSDGNWAYNGFLIQIQDVTDRKEHEENLRELSIMDVLTETYNRHGFINLSAKQIDIARRTNSGMYMLFLDLDGLKGINDSMGHKTGDSVLISAVDVLHRTFRSSDIIGRWGGDEFVVLMVNAGGISCEEISGRLQKNIDLINSSTAGPARLSMSWGIINFDPASEVTVEDLIREADEQMYRHKASKKPANMN
ncbi:MAG: diguanylate cyclase [Spirochaetes bacterium]|jgi:diguanylate cyclase (GGDEF)-like protein/PAS domain S-box-containing protein|nr:diguanylate cyclase [Spirochaetota bacterium]